MDLKFNNYGISITPNQSKKILRAVKNNLPVSISLSKEKLGGSANLELPLSKSQIAKIEKAKNKDKGVILKLTTNNYTQARKDGGGKFMDFLNIAEKGFNATKGLTDTFIAKPLRKALDKTGKTTDNQFSFTKGFTKRGKGEGGRSMIEEVTIDVPGQGLFKKVKDSIDPIRRIEPPRTYDIPENRGIVSATGKKRGRPAKKKNLSGEGLSPVGSGLIPIAY